MDSDNSPLRTATLDSDNSRAEICKDEDFTRGKKTAGEGCLIIRMAKKFTEHATIMMGEKELSTDWRRRRQAD